MLNFMNSFLAQHPLLFIYVAVAAVLPVVVVAALLVPATLVALSADRERGERARLVLRELLGALRVIFRFRHSSGQ
jgi:hypothetical protein